LELFFTDIQENLGFSKFLVNEMQTSLVGSLSSAVRHLRLSPLQALSFSELT